MYLVHQIIVCILYAVLFPLLLAIGGMDEYRYPILSKRVNFYLAPALDHNNVITKVCFDKR